MNAQKVFQENIYTIKSLIVSEVKIVVGFERKQIMAWSRLVLVVLATLLTFHVVQIDSCFLWGSDTGECITDSLDPLWRAANMPYCQAAVTYPACVPKYMVSDMHLLKSIRKVSNIATTTGASTESRISCWPMVQSHNLNEG